MLSIEFKRRQDARIRAEKLKIQKAEFKKRMSLELDKHTINMLHDYQGY